MMERGPGRREGKTNVSQRSRSETSGGLGAQMLDLGGGPVGLWVCVDVNLYT